MTNILSASPVSASALASNSSNTILFTNRHYFIGIFKVACNQLKAHPIQRSLKKEWTLRLKDSFVERGMDKGANPVKALLVPHSAFAELKGTWDRALVGDPPALPEGFALLVFDGQHRIAACELIEDSSEHWWYAEVYRRELEVDHPAELLTLMHLGNEERLAMNTDDADRFMALIRLRHYRDAGAISPDVYNSAQRRISNSIPKSIIRQGLGNLLRSQPLAEAIKRAVEHRYIASCFNAATWGKKLTIGRFFKLSASLIEEMTMQCSLIQGNRSELDPNPFQLSANACSLTQLSAAVTKKAPHPWKQLEGGIQGALERFSKRPSDFVTTLNPDGCEEWTLPDVVLLPSVLTSATTEKALRDMYFIAQHYVHMIAGPDYLERYTSNKAHSSEEDHPAGIIAKIILQMWNQWKALLEDLYSYKISDASSTSVSTYQTLISNSKEWWSLLRLLKARQLTSGLGLHVPKEFSYNVTTHGSQCLPPMEVSSAGASAPSLGEPNVLEMKTREEHGGENVSEQGGGKTAPVEIEGVKIDPSHKGNQSSDHESRDWVGSQPVIGAEPRGREARGIQRLRKRIRRERSLTTSEDEVEQTGSDCIHDKPTIRGGLKCHGDTVLLLQDLERTVPSMRPQEARALSDLVCSLMSLQGTGHAARVIGRLAEKIKPLTDRAEKATKMCLIYDEDDENFQIGGLNSQESQNSVSEEERGGGGDTEDGGNQCS